MQNPNVTARIEQLRGSLGGELSGLASPAWVNAKYVGIVWRMEQGGTTAAEREEAKVALTALAALAKLNGYGDRKQTSPARGAKAPKDIDAMLEALEPGSRARVIAMSEAQDRDR
jgi:hypothetical protein